MVLSPDDLQDLVNLQRLTVNNNQLGCIYVKSFEDLDSYNNLMSLLPDDQPALERLVRLNLMSNQWQNLPPDPIFACTQDSVIWARRYTLQLPLNLGGKLLHCSCCREDLKEMTT